MTRPNEQIVAEHNAIMDKAVRGHRDVKNYNDTAARLREELQAQNPVDEYVRLLKEELSGLSKKKITAEIKQLTDQRDAAQKERDDLKEEKAAKSEAHRKAESSYKSRKREEKQQTGDITEPAETGDWESQSTRDQYTALAVAWSRASDAARRRFLSSISSNYLMKEVA